MPSVAISSSVCKASATARASPSIGAYLDSAACVNLLPTRVISHPSLQQNGLIGEHDHVLRLTEYVV